MKNQPTLLNQTSFSEEEPLLEKPADYDEKLANRKKFFKTKQEKLLKILIFLFSFFLILIIALYFVFKKPKPVEIEKPTEKVEQVQSLDPLRKRIKVLSEDLNEADPTKQELPFPPVDLKIRIDPQAR